MSPVSAKRAARLRELGNPYRTMTLDRVISLWAAKAPVNIPGSQRRARSLEDEIERRGVAVPTPVHVGQEHALAGEGREEFDREVAAWRRGLPGGAA